MNNLLTLKRTSLLFYCSCLLVFTLSLYFGIKRDDYLLMFGPMSLLLGVFLATNYKLIFYAFFALIPFSVEYVLPNGLGTDLPSEQIMWLLTGICVLLFLNKFPTLDRKKYFDNLGFLLLIHFIWIGLVTLTSQHQVLSLKFFIAKTWYILPFYFFAIHMFFNRKILRKSFEILVLTMTISIIYVFVRHASLDFAFNKINLAGSPIYRNHVAYATLIVIVAPYIYLSYWRAKSSGLKWVYSFIAMMFVVATYYSYTRAAMVALMVAFGAFFIIKYRMVKYVLIGCSICLVIGISYLLSSNNFLKFAPNYERTIVHNNFDNLIEATYKLEDISTMERVHRWVAGVQMVKDKPMLGFGPSSFYESYQPYTVSSFETYVSDNPEKSTVHNYYLMTLIEQGIPGFIVFMALCFTALLKAEKTYYNLKDEEDKWWIMAATLSLIIILTLNLINDLIEADKCGPFFFLAMAIISVISYKDNQSNQLDN